MSDLGVVRYRKKPIVIEAIQWNGLNLQEIKNFVGDKLKCERYDALWRAGIAPASVIMTIETLEGEYIVSIGDYIIKGIKGEFYPCKADIFDETYEKVINEIKKEKPHEYKNYLTNE